MKDNLRIKDNFQYTNSKFSYSLYFYVRKSIMDKMADPNVSTIRRSLCA